MDPLPGLVTHDTGTRARASFSLMHQARTPRGAWWRGLQNRHLGLLAAVGLALALLYLPVFVHAVGVWRLDRELSFGFLVPPMAAGLAWLRRPWLRRAAPVRSGGAGLALLVGGLLLLVSASRAGIHALAGLTFLPTVLGAATIVGGGPLARSLFPSAALMTASLSLYRGLLAPLGFALLEVSARLAAVGGARLGAPVHLSGVHLLDGGYDLVVTQACSGMDSLLALLTLGGVFASLAQGSVPRRVALLALTVPIVLVANVVRLTLIVTLAGPLGQAVIGGFGHLLLSASVFVAAALVLGLAAVILRCNPPFPGTRSSSS